MVLLGTFFFRPRNFLLLSDFLRSSPCTSSGVEGRLILHGVSRAPPDFCHSVVYKFLA